MRVALEVSVAYAGVLLAGLGLLCLLRPLGFLRIGTRRRGAVALAIGSLLLFAAALLPAPLRKSERGGRLDEFIPAYQFNEVHSIRVEAPPDQVYRAIRSVTAEEIRFFRLLTWIRYPRLPGIKSRESILAPPPAQPILDVALRSGFLLLAEDAGRELVLGTKVLGGATTRIGTPEEFRSLNQPGVAKAAMNFQLADEGQGWTRVTTETRVLATDPSARRRFALYWRLIYPGSATIRRMWLEAIRRRAESESGSRRASARIARILKACTASRRVVVLSAVGR